MTSPRSHPVRRHFLRDFRAGANLDLFLVSAVSSVLLIRAYLELTGYPKIGGDQLHIAHLLWGGLFMITALVLVLSYLDRGARQLAALVGGVGFGTFIDEVGKFVTHDNDYFYRPAPAIMYAVFVLLYLAVRSIHRERTATREEYLVNALQETEEIVLGDLSSEERDRALRYLERSESREPLAIGLEALLRQAELVTPRQGRLARWSRRAIDTYRRIIELPHFGAALITFFVVQLGVKLVHAAMILDFGNQLAIDRFAWLLDPWAVAGERGVADVALLGSSLLAAAFVAAGVVRLRRSRLHAYRMFHRSVLVPILFGQIFLFYRDEWAALIGLGFNLLLFVALRYMIAREVSDELAASTPTQPRA